MMDAWYWVPHRGHKRAYNKCLMIKNTENYRKRYRIGRANRIEKSQREKK